MKIFVSIIFALIFNFLFLVGLQIGYLDPYGIDIYFNPFFAHNQPWMFAFFFIPTLLAFYIPKLFATIIFTLLTLITLSAFVAPKMIGHTLYAQSASYKIGKHSVDDITLLLSHRGRDFVLFEGQQRVKEFRTDQRVYED